MRKDVHVMEISNHPKTKKQNRSESGKGETPIIEIKPKQLQMICDLQTFKRKRTEKEILKAWKLEPDQGGYSGSSSQAKGELPKLMSLVLDILHMDHAGLADGPKRFMGFYFAFLAAMILGSEILSQKEIDKAIRQINTQYGINLNREWWLAFLDNSEVEFSRREWKDVIKWQDHLQYLPF